MKLLKDNPISPNKASEWYSVSIIILLFLTSFGYNYLFPKQIPINIYIQSDVIYYLPAWLFSFLLPSIALFIYIFLLNLPKNNKSNILFTKFSKLYHLLKDAIISILALIYFFSSLAILGYDINTSFWLPIFISLLFLIIGIMLNKFELNYFLGFKTIWSLKSKEIRESVNHLGGRLFIFVAFLIALLSFLPKNLHFLVFLLIIIALFIIPFFYSYYLHIKKNKK